MTAADTLAVRLVPAPVPVRLAVGLFRVVDLLVSRTFDDVSTGRVVIERRATGQALVRRTAPGGGERLVALMRADLERLDEPAFLERWGDPKRWNTRMKDARYTERGLRDRPGRG